MFQHFGFVLAQRENRYHFFPTFFSGTISVHCDFIQQSTSYVDFLVPYWVFRMHYGGGCSPEWKAFSQEKNEVLRKQLEALSFLDKRKATKPKLVTDQVPIASGGPPISDQVIVHLQPQTSGYMASFLMHS